MHYTVIKIGGSAITNKSTPHTRHPDVVARVVETIASYKPDTDEQLIILLGAGSFGHFEAMDGEQAACHEAIASLQAIIQNAFRTSGLAVTPVNAHTPNHPTVFANLLRDGHVPLISGGFVDDKPQSAEATFVPLAWNLMNTLDPPTMRVCLVGVEPGIQSHGSVVATLTHETVIDTIDHHDATGGMADKVQHARALCHMGASTTITDVDGLALWLAQQNTGTRVVETPFSTGHVWAFPTDTSFGLAVRCDDPAGLDALYQVKQRDAAKPVSLMVRNIDMLHQYAHVPAGIDTEWFFETPRTLICTPKDALPASRFWPTDKVAFRLCPLPAVARWIKAPITATSANISGQPACYSLQSLQALWGNQIRYYTGLGTLAPVPASHIWDATTTPWNRLR